jgi:hypothetical protein
MLTVFEGYFTRLHGHFVSLHRLEKTPGSSGIVLHHMRLE